MPTKTIPGQVTRLVEADPSRGMGPRVFFWPGGDATALRQIDGSSRLASGEITLFVNDLADFQVGEERDFEVPVLVTP